MILKKLKNQTHNEKLILVRETFDKYNLISALHSFLSTQDDTYKKVLPPLILLSDEEQKELILKTKNLKFLFNKGSCIRFISSSIFKNL